MFVDEKIGGTENFQQIIEAIVDTDGTELYIDVQGGVRTSSYVRNAIVQIVENQQVYNVNIKEIFGINWQSRNFVNAVVDSNIVLKIFSNVLSFYVICRHII